LLIFGFKKLAFIFPPGPFKNNSLMSLGALLKLSFEKSLLLDMFDFIVAKLFLAPSKLLKNP